MTEPAFEKPKLDPVVERKLLAAASQATFAVADLIETVRDGEISPVDNLFNGDTTVALADALKLTIEAIGTDDKSKPLLNMLHTFLEIETTGKTQ